MCCGSVVATSYELGSQGRIVDTLTNPRVVTSVTATRVSPEQFLVDVASSRPAPHALIDVGALVTGYV